MVLGGWAYGKRSGWQRSFLVTGATEGARQSSGARLRQTRRDAGFGWRNKEKSERVVADLKRDSGSEKLSLLLGDMSKLDDVRAVARSFAQAHDRLDVLVNNAGALFADYKLSPDGFEMTFALNHLVLPF